MPEDEQEEDKTITIDLDEEQIEAINEGNTKGQGGFQNLVASIQGNLDEDDGTLELTETLQERIPRYAKDYGQGGWEDELESMVGEEVMDDLQTARTSDDEDA